MNGKTMMIYSGYLRMDFDSKSRMRTVLSSLIEQNSIDQVREANALTEIDIWQSYLSSWWSILVIHCVHGAMEKYFILS